MAWRLQTYFRECMYGWVSVWCGEMFLIPLQALLWLLWVGAKPCTCTEASQTPELIWIPGGLFWAVAFPDSIKLPAALLFFSYYGPTSLCLISAHQDLHYFWQYPNPPVFVPNEVSTLRQSCRTLCAKFPWAEPLVNAQELEAETQFSQKDTPALRLGTGWRKWSGSPSSFWLAPSRMETALDRWAGAQAMKAPDFCHLSERPLLS